MATEKKDTISKLSAIPWVDFLQDQPPGSTVEVTGSWCKDQYGGIDLIAPELQLFCPETSCNANMFFSSKDGGATLKVGEWKTTYFTYWCRNCRKHSKMYSVAVQLNESGTCSAYKFGELPSFGPPIPSRVLRLLQPDRELFLSGRRCENQGLGIGAFAYYRRVVVNQWSRVIDEIIKVATTIGAKKDTLDALSAAKDQEQFSKSVKDVKHGIPPALLINGHNPLVLLHSALSQGVHNLSDTECLLLATSIRVVLVELAEKIGQALKDEKEITEAVSRLLHTHAEKSAKVKEID